MNGERLASRVLNACIIAAGRFGQSYCLFKNRDRNYVPDIKLIHELVDGVEVLYLYDDFTGWVEGLNEHGIGIVNSALMVSRDEMERDEVERTGKLLGDGEKVLEALSKDTLDKAVKVVKSYKGGLMGHTVVATDEKAVWVELPHEDSSAEFGDVEGVYVRTNHGVKFPDSGYVSGENEKSSKSRQQDAEAALTDVSDADGIGSALAEHRNGDRYESTNMVRDNKSNKKMRTTTQMVLDLTAKELVLYLLPGRVEWKGYENKLPKGHEPKLSYRVSEYEKAKGGDILERGEVVGIKNMKAAQFSEMVLRVASRAMHASRT